MHPFFPNLTNPLSLAYEPTTRNLANINPPPHINTPPSQISIQPPSPTINKAVNTDQDYATIASSYKHFANKFKSIKGQQSQNTWFAWFTESSKNQQEKDHEEQHFLDENRQTIAKLRFQITNLSRQVDSTKSTSEKVIKQINNLKLLIEEDHALTCFKHDYWMHEQALEKATTEVNEQMVDLDKGIQNFSEIPLKKCLKAIQKMNAFLSKPVSKHYTVILDHEKKLSLEKSKIAQIYSTLQELVDKLKSSISDEYREAQTSLKQAAQNVLKSNSSNIYANYRQWFESVLCFRHIHAKSVNLTKSIEQQYALAKDSEKDLFSLRPLLKNQYSQMAATRQIGTSLDQTLASDLSCSRQLIFHYQKDASLRETLKAEIPSNGLKLSKNKMLFYKRRLGIFFFLDEECLKLGIDPASLKELKKDKFQAAELLTAMERQFKATEIDSKNYRYECHFLGYVCQMIRHTTPSLTLQMQQRKIKELKLKHDEEEWTDKDKQQFGTFVLAMNIMQGHEFFYRLPNRALPTLSATENYTARSPTPTQPPQQTEIHKTTSLFDKVWKSISPSFWVNAQPITQVDDIYNRMEVIQDVFVNETFRIEKEMTKANELIQNLKILKSELDKLKQTSRLDSLQKKIYELHDPIKTHLALLKTTLNSKPKSNCPIIDLTDWQVQVNTREAELKSLETQYKGLRKDFEVIFQKVKDEELSIVHLENFINKAKREPVSDHLFLHTLGDFIGKHSALEGGNTREMLLSWLHTLKAKVDSLSDPLLCSHTSRVDFCRHFFGNQELPFSGAKKNDVVFFQNMKSQLEIALEIWSVYEQFQVQKFHDILQKYITQLKPGELFFFPCGWPSHSMMFEIIRQTNEQFTIRIYNAGRGIRDYHAGVIVHTKEKFLRFTEKVNVNQKDLLNLPKLKAFLEIQLDHKTPPMGPDDLYRIYLSQVGGEFSDKLYTPDDIQQSQQSGTCSFMSIKVALTQHLRSSEGAGRLIFEYEFAKLMGYYEQKIATLDSEERTISRELLRKGIENFARLTKEYHTNHVINDYEFIYTTKKIEEIEKGLAIAETKYLEYLQRHAPFLNLFRGGDTAFEYNLKKGRVHDLNLFNRKIHKHTPIIFGSVLENPLALANTLNQINDQIIQANNHAKYQVVQQVIKHLALALPLPLESYWTQIPFKDVEKIASTLKQISLAYIWSFQQNSLVDEASKKQTSPIYLTQLKLFTIADKLYRMHKDQFGFEIPNLYQREFDHLFNNHNFEFQIRNPIWDREFLQLQSYWNEHPYIPNTHNSFVTTFFGFDAFPAGQATAVRTISAVDVQENPYLNWPDIEWAIERVKSSWEINKYPDLARKNEIFQALYLLVGNEGMDDSQLKEKLVFPKQKINLIPQIFYELRDLAFLINYFHNRYTEVQPPQGIKPDFSLGITYHAHSRMLERDQEKTYRWDLTHRLFGIENGKPTTFSGNTEQKAVTGELVSLTQTIPQIVDSRTLFSLDWIPGSSWKIFYNRQTRFFDRFNPNSLLKQAIILANYLQISFQENAELMALISFPELQIEKTVAYFQQHFYLLQNKTYQGIFMTLMFESGLLAKELEKSFSHSEKLSNALADFCNDSFQLYLNLGDTSTALFFLQINRLLDQYVTFNPSNFQVNFKHRFMNTRKQLASLISNSQIDTDLKAQIFLQIALCYSNTKSLDTAMLTDLLHAVIGYQMSPLQENGGLEMIKIEVKDILHSRLQEIQNLLNSEERNTILNTIYKLVTSKNNSFQWQIEGAFPHYISEDQTVSIDVLEGIFYEKGGIIKNLPNYITIRNSFKALFQTDSPTFASEIGKNLFEFSSNGIRFRIYFESYYDNYYQREIEGSFYWLIQATYNYNKDWEFAFSNRALLEGNHIWYSDNPLGMYISDSTTGDLKYQIKFRYSDSNNPSIESVHQLKKSKETGLVLLNLHNFITKDDLYKNLRSNWAYSLTVQDPVSGTFKRLQAPEYFFHRTISYSSDSIKIYLEDDLKKIKGFDRNTFGWQSKDDYSTTYRLTDNGIHPLYEMTLDPHHTKVLKIEKVQNGELEEINLWEIENSQMRNFQFITRFEDPVHTLIWLEKGMPKLIEFPRYDLSFDVSEIKGKRRASSSKHPQYYLSQDQFIKSLSNLPHYLLLEKTHSNGQIAQKVLIPLKKLEHLSTSQSSLVSYARTINENNHQYFTYEVDSTGELIAENDQARFYLCYLYLWKHQYQKAMLLLKGDHSHLKPYSSSELEMLKDIGSLYDQNHDPDPRASAVSLQACAALIRNKIDFSEKTTLNIKLGNILQKYAANYEFLNHHFQLTSEDILLCVEALQSISENVKNFVQTYISHDYRNVLAQHLVGHTLTVQNQVRVKEIDVSREKILFDLLKNYDVAKFAQAYLYNKDGLSSKSLLLRSVLFESFKELYDDHGYGFSDHEINAPYYKNIYRNLILKISGIQLSQTATALEIKTTLLDILHIIQTCNKPDEQIVAFACEYKIFHSYRYFYPALSTMKTLLEDVEWYSSYNPEMTLKREKVITFLNKNIFDHLKRIAEENFLTLLRNSKKPLLPALKTELQIQIPNQNSKNSLCLAFEENFDLAWPLISPTTFRELYVYEKTVSDKAVEKRQHMLKEIVDWFAIPSGKRFIEREFAQYRKEIISYFSAPEAKKYGISDSHIKNLIQLEHKLIQQAELLDNEVKALKATITQQLNRSSSRLRQAQQKADYIGDVVERITIDEAIQFFWRRDTAEVTARNPDLSMNAMLQIDKMVLEFLLKSTHQQHLKRFAAKIDLIGKAIQSTEPEAEIEAYIQEMVEIADSKREYNVKDHPEYLVFEYYMEFLIRKEQVDNLAKLEIKDGRIKNPDQLGIVLEMFTGAGKTAVFFTLLNLFNADGINMAVGVMTENLLPSQSKELVERLSLSFKKSVEVMSFNRESTFSVSAVSRINERFERIIHDKRVLLWTDNSLKTYFLKFVEALHDYNAFSPINNKRVEKGREIELFRTGFRHLRKATVILDEIHIIKNVLKSNHFTIGEPVPLKLAFSDPLIDLLLLLATTPGIKENIRVGFIKSDTKIAFTPKRYLSKIVPLMIEQILAGKIYESNEEVQTFLKNLNSKDSKLVISYLKNENNPDAYTYVAKLTHQRKIQDFLATVKEGLNVLLPLTLSNTLFEHYGPIPLKALRFTKSPLMAIPMHKGRPAITESMTGDNILIAQFGTDGENLLYSVLMHLSLGIDLDLIENEIKGLQAIIKSILLLNPKVELSTIPAYSFFLELAGNDKKYAVLNLSSQDMKQIRLHINNKPHLQAFFIKKYVVPQIKIYLHQLNVNGQIYGYIHDRLQGLSATLWNVNTFAEMVKEVHLSNSAAILLKALWENSPSKVDVISIPSYQNVDTKIVATLEQIYLKGSFPVGSFIDIAGFFKGIENEKVAKHIASLPCWKNTPIKRVAFYDADEQLVVFDFVTQKVIPLNSNMKKEETIAYWDQAHTTGSDIKLGATMTAAVTLGKHQLRTDTNQGFGRLRGILKAQKARAIILDEDADYIREILKSVKDNTIEELELKHLLFYVFYNQAIKLGDHTYRALVNKIHAVPIKHFMDCVIDPKIDLATLTEIYDQISDLFESHNEVRPYLLYGKNRKMDDSKKIINQIIEDFLESDAMQAFENHPVLIPKLPGIKKELQTLKDKHLPLLPEELLTIDKCEREKSVETQKDVDKDVEKEKEKAKQKEVEIDKEHQKQIDELMNSVDEPVITWSEEGLFSKNYYSEGLLSNSTNFIERILGFTPPQRPVLCSLATLLGTDPKFKDAAPAFHPSLLVSENLIPLQPGTLIPKKILFSIFMKHLSEQLIVEDCYSGDIKIVLLDDNDASMLEKMIVKDNKKITIGRRDVRLALSNLAAHYPPYNTGIYLHGKNPINEQLLEKNEVMRLCKVQANFIKGVVNPLPTDIAILKKWLKENNPQALYKLFKTISIWRDKSREAFPASNLAQIFKELGVKIDS